MPSGMVQWRIGSPPHCLVLLWIKNLKGFSLNGLAESARSHFGRELELERGCGGASKFRQRAKLNSAIDFGNNLGYVWTGSIRVITTLSSERLFHTPFHM